MKEDKDQESIQSSTTPDPEYQWESDKFCFWEEGSIHQAPIWGMVLGGYHYHLYKGFLWLWHLLLLLLLLL